MGQDETMQWLKRHGNPWLLIGQLRKHGIGTETTALKLADVLERTVLRCKGNPVRCMLRLRPRIYRELRENGGD